MANPIFLDRNEARAGSSSWASGSGSRSTPTSRSRPLGRLAAARRDPQGALPRGAHPRPRRADGGPHAAGDQGDLRGPAPPGGRGPQRSSSSATSCTRCWRSPTGSRSSDAARSWARSRRDQRGRPRRADGRPQGPARSSTAASPIRPPRPGGQDLRVSDDRGPRGGRRRQLRGPSRRDPRVAGVAGNGQDELVEALTGLRKPTSGTVELGPRRHRTLARATSSGRACRSSRRPPRSASSSASPSRTTCPDPVRRTALSPGASCATTRRSTRGPRRRSPSTTSGPRRPRPAGPCPAATSRRPSWRGSSAAS